MTEEELNGLIGKTLEDASKVLTNAGCVGYYTEVYSETVPEGAIITWKENSENSYTMIVSLGKEPAKNTGSSAGDHACTVFR